MIALTQEKREELKAFLSASIEKRCTVYTLAKQRELELLRDKVALASLIAEPEYARLFGDTGDTLVRCHPKSEGRIAIFTAPPVPEIKLPELMDYADPHTQYCEGIVDGYNRCLAEIKRLNGWGE